MVEELKFGKFVIFEYFDEVIIYFSEIMVFIDLVLESMFMEVKKKFKSFNFNY